MVKPKLEGSHPTFTVVNGKCSGVNNNPSFKDCFYKCTAMCIYIICFKPFITSILFCVYGVSKAVGV